MESDVFWISLTAVGYRQFVTPISSAIKRLVTEYDGVLLPTVGDDTEVNEIIAALKRSAGAMMKGKSRERKARREVEDDSDE